MASSAWQGQQQRSSASQIKIEVHPGDEYLASLEPQSLQVSAYVKLVNATEAVTVVPNIWLSVVGNSPLLRHGDSTSVTGAEDVITYLKEQGFDLDQKLTESQKNEIIAYSALLTDKLRPAILYSKWLDSQNYVDVTRRSYANILHFPFTLFYLSWQHRAAHNLIMRGAPPECTLQQRGMELLSKAEECIGLLSARLGDRDYFFGSSPSSLDALMFGYLEVVLQSPLPSSNSLYNKLHSCVNLSEFCKRIRSNQFPEKRTRVSKVRGDAPSSQTTVIWKDPTVWLSVGVAAVVLGVQGVRVGLFNRIGRWVTSNAHGIKWNTTNSLQNSDNVN